MANRQHTGVLSVEGIGDIFYSFATGNIRIDGIDGKVLNPAEQTALMDGIRAAQISVETHKKEGNSD